MHHIPVEDKRLARVIRECRDLPGQELFQYVDEFGDVRSIDSSEVNGYLRETSGEKFTARDFRTWAGTIQTALVLTESEPCAAEAKNKTHRCRGNRTRRGPAGKPFCNLQEVLCTPGDYRELARRFSAARDEGSHRRKPSLS
jgi:hypothetical protein